MTATEAARNVGRTVYHSGHGNAVLLRVSRMGCRIAVWGGINGDRKYEFTVPAAELTLGHKGG